MKFETLDPQAGVPLSAALTQSSCTTAQAARILGVSVGTVQKLVERSELQAWRTPGGHRRVLLNSLHRYQQTHHMPVQGGVTPKSTSGLHLVLVDDAPVNTQALEALQATWGERVKCESVSSGVSALMGLGQAVPDVLIVNTAMRDMDVGALLAALQPDPRFVGMVCVVLLPEGHTQPGAEGAWPETAAVVQGPLRLDWLQGLISGLNLVRSRATPLGA